MTTHVQYAKTLSRVEARWEEKVPPPLQGYLSHKKLPPP